MLGEAIEAFGGLSMKTLVSSSSAAAAVLIVLATMVHAKTLNLDFDLKKPESTSSAAEADQWLTKGNAAYQAKNYDEAMKCYQKATALDPGFGSAYYNLGIVYAEKGMLDEAIAAYKQVLTIRPDYFAASNNLSTAYMKKGMVDEAISELEKVLASNPNFPHAHFNLGECYFSKGNNKQAADHYYKAGMLFVDRGDKEWTQKSYDSLKKTNSEELEKSLFEKMNPGEKVQENFLEHFIEIKPKKAD